MPDDPTMTGDDFDRDPQARRLLDHLAEGPLASPPPHIVKRVRNMMGPQHGRAEEPISTGASMIQHAAEIIARLIFDSRGPALAGFRGGGAGGDGRGGTETHLIYEFEDGEIDLQIQSPPVNADRSGAQGRLLAQVESNRRARTAQLQAPDRTLMAERAIDEHGFVAFDLDPGRYQLTIVFERATVRVPSIDI